MPALSSTMTEGKIVSWLMGEGDAIGKGDAVVVVESDKADMDVESFVDGIIAHIAVGDGEVATVGAPIAYVVDSESEIEEAKAKAGGAPAPAPAAPAAAAPPRPAPAAAPRAAAAPAEAEPVGVVAANGLAARVECSLGPGVLGGEMALANDDRGLRVVVARAAPTARRAGVAVGDVLLSLNARALPPKLDAGELMALLRGNPRYMLSPVDACLWRPKLARQQGVAYAVAGFRSAAAGVEWRRVADTGDVYDGYFVATRVPKAARATGLRPGDVLVGLDYEPVPAAAPAPALARLFGDWAADGKLLLNYLRPGARAADLAAAARAAPRAVLVAAPAEAQRAAELSGAELWGTAALAATVTGDGGAGDGGGGDRSPRARRAAPEPAPAPAAPAAPAPAAAVDYRDVVGAAAHDYARANGWGFDALYELARLATAHGQRFDVEALRRVTRAKPAGAAAMVAELGALARGGGAAAAAARPAAAEAARAAYYGGRVDLSEARDRVVLARLREVLSLIHI